MITACDFIRDRAILRRKSELSNPVISSDGEKRDLLLKDIPLSAKTENQFIAYLVKRLSD